MKNAKKTSARQKWTNKSEHPFDALCEDFVKNELFEFLCQKYVQHSNKGQKALGQQYTTAETHDLAEELARWIRTNIIG